MKVQTSRWTHSQIFRMDVLRYGSATIRPFGNNYGRTQKMLYNLNSKASESIGHNDLWLQKFQFLNCRVKMTLWAGMICFQIHLVCRFMACFNHSPSRKSFKDTKKVYTWSETINTPYERAIISNFSLKLRAQCIQFISVYFCLHYDCSKRLDLNEKGSHWSSRNIVAGSSFFLKWIQFWAEAQVASQTHFKIMELLVSALKINLERH